MDEHGLDRAVTAMMVVLTGLLALLLLLTGAQSNSAAPPRTDKTAAGTVHDALAPLADFSASYKTGPATARQNDVITYTIVVVNDGALAQNVILSDGLPFTVVFVPGSCSYRRPAGSPQTCGPLSQMWQEDLDTNERITTTFAVQVTVGTMNWSLMNCAHIRWDSNQYDTCFTTVVNSQADFSASHKTGPATARQNDVITYTVVAINNGALAQNVILADEPPFTTMLVPGSCSYRRDAGAPQPCGPPTQMWQEDLNTNESITTTFAVQVTAGTMNWPLVNCAHIRWDSAQYDTCFTTVVNSWLYAYLPLVMRSGVLPFLCAPQLIAEVPTGPGPLGVALDTAGRRAFVAHRNGITVIDLPSRARLTEIALSAPAFGIAYDADRNRIWVTQMDADRVVVLDGTTYATLANMAAGDGPHSVAYNPTTGRVYVTNFQGWTVSAYDAGTMNPLVELTGFAEPAHVAVNPVTNKIYVANHRPDNHVTVINGATHATRQIRTGLIDAYGITVDTTRNLVYATAIAHGRISIIDGATDIQLGHMDIRRGNGALVPLRVIVVNPGVGPEGHLLLTTSSADAGLDQFLLIPNGWPSLGTPVPLNIAGYSLEGIALDPIENRVWVTNVGSGLVSVVQDGLPVCSIPFYRHGWARDEFHIEVSTVPIDASE